MSSNNTESVSVPCWSPVPVVCHLTWGAGWSGSGCETTSCCQWQGCPAGIAALAGCAESAAAGGAVTAATVVVVHSGWWNPEGD